MTNNIQPFQLEQFYLVLSGTAGIQVLARSAAIRPEHIVECRRVAALLPPPAVLRSGGMPLAFGIFRGETVDYIIAKAMAAPHNAALVHYVLVPGAALRALGGNLHLIEPFAGQPIPVEQRNTLSPLSLVNALPPTAEAQIDDMLALMGYCRNSLKVMTGLLAALVQGWGIAVVNAPPALHDRLTFVQGLLSLLPAPARVAITFATCVSDPAVTNPQIKFLVNDSALEHHVTFDWATGKLRQDPPDDPYARFIMTQLRLDASLVVEQTEKLARTAVWRAMRRENMASALAWASKRASIDSAVVDGLPADRELVASVLREDPTLPDDLRLAYVRHLLAFSLALGDLTHTEIIPTAAAQNREIADVVYEQLWIATSTDRAPVVYDIVERWITQAPPGADTSRWRPLLGQAALARTNTLLAGEPEKLITYLSSFLDTPPVLQLESAIAQIIGVCRKRAYDNHDVAQVVFLLAVTHLPLAGLQRLLADSTFTNRLPPALRAAFPFLTPDGPKPAPAGVLARAAEAFGRERQPIILARLLEWALTVARLDLLDADVLGDLVGVAISPVGDRYDLLFQHVVHDLSNLNLLKNLRVDVQRRLIELSLSRRRYDEAVRQLSIFQEMLYQGGRERDMSQLTRLVFREVPIDTRALLAALDNVQRGQLKPATIANADIGVLEARNWSTEVEPAARHLTELFYSDPRLIAITGVEPAMRLLRANAERKDGAEALRAAGAIIEYALTFEEHPPELVEQVYALLNWDSKVAEEGLEVMRNYVRGAAHDRALTLPRRLGEKYGEGVRTMLEATYRMRLCIGGTDMAAFADEVQVAARLLIDLSVFYYEGRDLPQVFKLRRNVEGMPGGLTEPERSRLARNLITMSEQIVKLYQLYRACFPRRNRAEIDARRTGLIKNRTLPVSAVEALLWLSGILDEGQTAVVLNLNREAPAYLLGTRSLNIFVRETDLIVKLLGGLLEAFPEEMPIEIDRRAWETEIDALWGMLSLYKQREIHRPLVENLQYLAQILLVVGERTNERHLQMSGYGRQLYIGRAQPRSVTEVLRWLAGYFAHEHTDSAARE